MTGAGGELAYQRLRAPQAPDGILLLPPAGQFAATGAANRRQRDTTASIDVAGLPLAELRRAARNHLLSAARQHSLAYRDFPAGAAEPPRSRPEAPPEASGDEVPSVVLTGHQPQLFHPGVWFKNFVLADLARDCGATGINLVIDNDTARAAVVRVPTGSPAEPRLVAVPLDATRDEVPYEERPIHDPDLFATFGERTRQLLDGLIADPLVEPLWEAARAAARSATSIGSRVRLGYCLAQARHVIEGQCGLTTLDVPLSTVCDAWPFLWFAVHLCEHREALSGMYNAALAEYRRTHGIRSRSHPVPELAVEDDWREVPFWVWSVEQPRRRRLFVRRVADQLEFTDRAGWQARLEHAADGSATRAVEQLVRWREAGWKIRPRALTTTLYARLVLGDHFVHGIGGAKYDQLTDALFARFWGVTPPAFVTATATVCLPIDHPHVTCADVGAREVRLRELTFHPERWLEEAGVTEDYAWNLVREKRQWLATELPRGARLTRHRALGALNETLGTFVEPLRQRWLVELSAARVAERRHELLGSREFSFCLFSRHDLPARLLALSARAR